MPASIMEAVSAAIDEATPTIPAPATTDTPPEGTDDGPDTQTADSAPAGEGDAGADPAAAGESADPAGGTDPGAGEAQEVDADAGEAVRQDENGRWRDAKGLFAAAPKGTEAGAPAAAGADPKPKDGKPGEAKKPDPINDPLPTDAKPRTVERIQSLVETAKTVTAERDQARADFDAVMAPIADAGLDAEQFRDVMALMKLVNSNSVADKQQALRLLQETADELAQAIGVTPTGVDPLQGFDDLIDMVNAGKVTRAVAEETARGRRLHAAQQRQIREEQHARQVQQQTTAEQQRRYETGRATLAEAEATLKALDPQFAVKMQLLRADPTFLTTLRAANPLDWAALFTKRYREMRLPEAQAQPGVPAGTGAPRQPQPLRTKTPAGATTVPPKSAVEAVDAALMGL